MTVFTCMSISTSMLMSVCICITRMPHPSSVPRGIAMKTQKIHGQGRDICFVKRIHVY